MNEEHLASLFNIKSLLDDLKEENTIQPKIDKYFRKINIKYRIPDYRYSGKINLESILGHKILFGLTRGYCT